MPLHLQTPEHPPALERYYSIQTLDEAVALGHSLASLFPDPDRTTVGLTELLINAVEHGNLGIGYAEKTQLVRENRWEEEVRQRQRHKEHAHKKVDVYFWKENSAAIVTICDEGNGFDWKPHWEVAPERAADPNGRGIIIAHRFSFDEVQFLGNGQCVRATTQL